MTAAELIARTAKTLAKAPLYYGHGTDNPDDEACALVLHALGQSLQARPAAYRKRATLAERQYLRELIALRIDARIPAVYLIGETFFAGLSFKTDPRALIPRSPLAELIEQRFAPWIDAAKVRRVLDVGTGSGCIGIAIARYLPKAIVDATDVSAAALTLAAENCRRHRLTKRVNLLKSDLFSAIGRRRYDIIVSNPPYVGAREMAGLPPEYRHEPVLALAAGHDGLDLVRGLLAQARQHLRPGGLLVVEVGNSERAVRRAWPRVPFTWLEFARGGGGVFLLNAEQCQAIP